MSVYTEMLQMALQADEPAHSATSELVAQALARRLDLDGGGDAASRLARALAYDVTLIRLCDRLGIEHDMEDAVSAPVERALAGRLPDLGAGMRQT